MVVGGTHYDFCLCYRTHDAADHRLGSIGIFPGPEIHAGCEDPVQGTVLPGHSQLRLHQSLQDGISTGRPAYHGLSTGSARRWLHHWQHHQQDPPL